METVLILGATSDIAQAIASKLADRGYDLVLAARDMNYLQRIQQHIQIRYPVNVKILQFEATDFNSHGQFVQNLNPFPELTILCFGYLGKQEYAEEKWEEAEKVLFVNYVGAVSILNHIAKVYKTKKRGTIVGISSVAGDRSRQSNYFYGSAKAGLTAYLSGLRNQLYPFGVHVLTVKPGYVRTRMTEGMQLPSILVTSPENVALKIEKAISRKENVIYIKSIWRWIMLCISIIPENMFKRMRW